jgi:hypothetical protein
MGECAAAAMASNSSSNQAIPIEGYRDWQADNGGVWTGRAGEIDNEDGNNGSIFFWTISTGLASADDWIGCSNVVFGS